jgi:hypothetical protein
VGVVSVDQKHRIKGNRSLLTKPVPALAGSAAVSSEHDYGVERIEILCECSDPLCSTILVVRLSDYARIRPEARQFAVAVGHEVEFSRVRVTLHTDTYEFVEPWRT